MLSYRHSFHAGNFADLVKHIVLVDILEHLILKEKPFEYIDTHSGAGIYDLQSDEGRKLQEFTSGIGKLKPDEYPELSRYFQIINTFNDADSLRYYPGSPAIAKYFLRPQDKAWLYELHPQDYSLLDRMLSDKKSVRVHCQDGFVGLNSLVPPASRRGLVLIDPSYEIKSEYDRVLQCLVKAHKKFSHGIYAIWYPVVNRHRVDKMETLLVESGIGNIQRFELGISIDTIEKGMTSAGMFVINPPWKLFDKMLTVLPKVATDLATSDKHFYKCDVLVNE